MKRIYTFIVLVALCTLAQAKPARMGTHILHQPDGTELRAYLHGDAFFHFYTTEDGMLLEQSADGFYQAKEMPSDSEMSKRRASRPKIQARQKQAALPRNLAPRGLIILVNFSDLAFTTEKAEMDSMLNGLNYTRRYSGYNDSGRRVTISSKGSARQYFHDVSMGQYNPVFDVVGPVTISRSYSYYGQNDYNGDDQNVEQMIKEACQEADALVDFKQYDNNGDGIVDFVYVIYAGYGEADGAGNDYVWPHNYHLTYSGINCTVDGKRVDNYACSNELDYNNRQHDGIGTFCHEFSHVLGLPDFYVTNNGTHKTMGSWDILDYGPYNNDGNTPPSYSAYERFFMGWLTPTVITDACSVELHPLTSNNAAALITPIGNHNLVGNNPNPKTFYLLENRQKEGWDAYLPGHGMLITKITFTQNKWEGNTVNNTASSMGVDIIEADGSAPSYNALSDNGYKGKLTDAYPAGSDQFLQVPEYQVTYVDEMNGIITFLVNGGGTQVILDVENTPTDLNAQCVRKVFYNGEIHIERDGNEYDMLGHKIQ